MSPIFESDLFGKIVPSLVKPQILVYWLTSNFPKIFLTGTSNGKNFESSQYKWFLLLNFGIPFRILISIGISILILRSQTRPHVMYSSAMCKWIFWLSRGKVLHIYICFHPYLESTVCHNVLTWMWFSWILYFIFIQQSSSMSLSLISPKLTWI